MNHMSKIITVDELRKMSINGQIFSYPVKQIRLTLELNQLKGIELETHGKNSYERVNHYLEIYASNSLTDKKPEFKVLIHNSDTFTFLIKGSVETLTRYLFDNSCISNETLLNVLSEYNVATHSSSSPTPM